MKRLITASAIAIVTNITTTVMIQPATAQILELGLLAGTALNALLNQNSEPKITPTPQPLPERNFTVGTDNLNGNNFNFSLFPDLTNSRNPNQVQFTPIPQNTVTPLRSR
ncbi:MAG TPA: hypothetical protein ACFCUY_05670 [Xenococcaceae cyanobacterium]